MKVNKIHTVLIIVCIFIISVAVVFLRKHELRQPHILLITIDALRSDHMGCYGYTRNTTPFLDTFMEDAVLFTQALSHSPHTPTSMGSFATGVYGMKHRINNWGDTLNPSYPTLAEELKKNGYKTIYLSSNLLMKNCTHGFDKGFDEISTKDIPSHMLIPSIIDRFKNIRDKEKLFLWTHYMGVHRPYFAPQQFLDVFLRDELFDPQKRLPIVEEVHGQYGYNGIPQGVVVEGITNPDYYIALYDASISYLDQQLKVLCEKLKELKLYDNTMIIISADHGELLGEHGLYFHHGAFLYEPLLKIPLIIKTTSNIKGEIVRQPVCPSVDTMPTIIDILGTKTDSHFDGCSLIPIILSHKKNPRELIFSDDGSGLIAVRDHEWKLLRYGGANQKEEDILYELYNLEDDPDELVNLVELNEGKTQLLKQKIYDYLKLDEPRDQERGTLLDEEAIKVLKSLGYAQ